ncbi:hypothetical protein [Mesorhizobium sp. 8]|uniref:hypothetical protein n=1 Tax=Mesorhizobium sp. 8 TaxID=2584466 RepID=UPI001AEEDD12|nr:hypothetical protein [Mesorhizobium sp. 8]
MQIVTSLIHALPVSERRCFDRREAASYVGVSVGTFDKLVRTGEMPSSIELFGRKVWDRRALDDAVDAKSPSSRFASPSRVSHAPPPLSPLDAWRNSHG